MSPSKNGELKDPEVLIDLVSRISEGVYITNVEGRIQKKTGEMKRDKMRE